MFILLKSKTTRNLLLQQLKEYQINKDTNLQIRKQAIQLFPILAMSYLNVVLSPSESLNGWILVKDQHGKNIYREKVQLFADENRLNLEIENLPQGMYMIQFVNEEVHKVKKFMKM